MTVSGTTARIGAWHQSAINLLVDGCAWRYHLTYNLGLEDPPGWGRETGTATHAAVEEHELQRLDWWRYRGRLGDPEGITVDRGEDIIAQHLEDMAPKIDPEKEGSLEDSIDKAVAAWHNWFDAPIPDAEYGGDTLRGRVMRWRPIAVEPYFKVWRSDWARRPMGGWMDQVYQDLADESFIIVDLKTAKDLGRWHRSGEGKKVQAAHYAANAVLACNLPIRTVPRWEYHVTRTSRGSTSRFEAVRVVAIDIDELDIDYLRQKIGEAERMVAEGDYPTNPDWFLCSERWCPFYAKAGSPCPARPEGYQ